MCGFIGVYGDSKFSKDDIDKSITFLNDRGPDSQRSYIGEKELLGFARLSIRDLSDDGMQPMFSSDGNYSIIFNGEIYNYEDLKKSLLSSGIKISTKCDTEILLKYFIKYGIDRTLADIEGMFSFCIHKKNTNQVFIARDLIGEKPFYYFLRKHLIVSSNLYSIVQLTKEAALNLQSVSNYLHYGYCVGNQSTVEGIRKLPPGSYAIFDTVSSALKEYSYKEEKLKHNRNKKYDKDYFIRELDNSIKNTLLADVPVGCFLSGGIDSSLVTLLAKKHKNDLKTFSVGFSNKNYDESNMAKYVANNIGTDHYQITLDDKDIYKTIKNSKWIFDEPFSDASYIAMYEVAKFARKHVKVCISGDGGDELFSGYNRHLLTKKIYRLRFIPLFIRKTISDWFSAKTFLNSFLKKIYGSFFNKLIFIQAFDEKLDKFFNALDFYDLNDLYFKILAGKDYSKSLQIPVPNKPKIKSDIYHSLANYDLFNYIHEDVLVKVDRCTMSASLEARAPLLNYKLVNFSLNCSPTFHLGELGQKQLLKEILFEGLKFKEEFRNKKGFSVPYRSVLENELKESFLDFLKIASDLNLNNELISKIRNKVSLFYEGKFYDYKFIWNSYFFLRWYCNINEIVAASKEE